ncbi:condensation domain-containing protein [Dactylosporangium sp. NPDC051541]|uniref:condensation domain-containing protein n=1 Tax=Dactylosporangium sp. NPDC051541 TaxID=3363977 RepID=UPI0037B6E758
MQVIPVAFRGERAVSAPLTVGQLNVAKWLVAIPHSPAALLDQRLPVPPGTPLRVVVAALGALLSRHEGLRSRYTLGGPGEQRVLESGEVPLRLLPPAEKDRLADHGRAEPLDVALDPPVRFVAAGTEESITDLVAVYSHLAVDFQALLVLHREFAALVRDPAARLGEVAQQPVDRADAERQPARRRRQEQAMRHWSRHLRAAPAHLYARPRVTPDTGSGAYGISSEAAAQALDRIAARTRVSRPTIVLAAWCALLYRRTGYDTCRFVMLSANRFESDLRDFVGTLAQSTFVSVEVAGAGFDELVRRAFGAVLQAGVNGAYHVDRQNEGTLAVTAERGVAPSFEPLFNSSVVDTRGFDPPLPPGPPAPTDLAWADLPPTKILLRFDLGQIDDTMVARVWTGDTGRVTPAETRELVLALERLLVAAAVGDLDAAAVAAALDLEPIERPPGWHLIDGCWVDLAEVQRLLDDAFGPGTARLSGPDLTAHISDPTVDPETAHERCLALLPGRHAAIAPRQYVCGG